MTNSLLKPTIDKMIKRFGLTSTQCDFKWLAVALTAVASCFGQAQVHAEPLTSVIREVTNSHPDVRVQQSGLQVARQQLAIAHQQYLPTPSVSIEQAQASSSDTQYTGDSRVAVLRLQQPLWTGGRLTAGVGKAEAGVAVRESALEETRQQLAQATVQSWGEWCSAQARLGAVERNLSLHRALQSRVQRRVQEGGSTPSELVMTEGRVAQATAQLQTHKGQAQMARAKLQQLLGKPLQTPDCIWQALPGTNNTDLDKLLTQTVDTSPVLARLRAQLDQSRHEVDERKADMWPEVFVRAEHQRGNFAVASYPNTNRLFVGMTSRFGAGLSTAQQIESAVQRKQGATQELEGGERKVTEQLQTLWIQLQDVEVRLPSMEQLVNANLSTQEAWDRQFLAGRKSWLDVMNAARELMQSEMELADARVNRQSLQWRLALLTQGVDKVLSSAP
jgi:adhesin transport system outer membrane protein